MDYRNPEVGQSWVLDYPLTEIVWTALGMEGGVKYARPNAFGRVEILEPNDPLITGGRLIFDGVEESWRRVGND